MKYCVNGRQPYSVIKMADEIMFQEQDSGKIFDLIPNYIDKTVILNIKSDCTDWTNWLMFNESFNEFYIALHDLSRVKDFNEHGIKWYWPYYISSFYELDIILKLNPSYLLIGAPLTFDLDAVKAISKDIPLRAVPNIGLPSHIPLENINGVASFWVRPEDVESYAEYINCFEFDEVDLQQESTLLRIYKDQKWPGNLNLLITRLNHHLNNRYLDKSFGINRLNCGQRCLRNPHTCNICHRLFRMSDMINKAMNEVNSSN